MPIPKYPRLLSPYSLSPPSVMAETSLSAATPHPSSTSTKPVMAPDSLMKRARTVRALASTELSTRSATAVSNS